MLTIIHLVSNIIFKILGRTGFWFAKPLILWMLSLYYSSFLSFNPAHPDADDFDDLDCIFY